jgi:hypothetical protein
MDNEDCRLLIDLYKYHRSLGIQNTKSIVTVPEGKIRCFFLFIKIRCIAIKDIAARALGDAMVASHELRFVPPRMLASLFYKKTSEATDG